MRDSIVAKKLPHCESPSIGLFFIELTISKRKWYVLFACRLPNFNKGDFFNEISITLSKASKSYGNIVLASNRDIDLLDQTKNTWNR